MARKLEASGHVRREPAPGDRRASVVALTASGRAVVDRVRQFWCTLAEETVSGLPARTVAELPGVLTTMAGNVDTRPPGRRYGPGD
jgi:DNA-binding MarR family transcriptional regulator